MAEVRFDFFDFVLVFCPQADGATAILFQAAARRVPFQA